MNTLNDDTIQKVVHETIREALRRRDQTPEPFSDDDDLVATGLTSLDLGAVIAMLERELKVDPFLELRSITEVVTVGDLCRAYRESLAAAPAKASDDDDLRDAHARALRRRE